MNFDVVVVGAGPGGYVAAIRAAQHGKKVAIVEREYLGGVCLNVGCIPSKAMITAAHFLHRVQHDASEMGIEIKSAPKLDAVQLQKWKSGVSQKMSDGVKQLLSGNKIEIVYGEAEMTSAREMEVRASDGSKKTLQAKNIVLATGSRPIEIPGFPFDEKRILSSTGALALEHVPKSLVVIGGGYIGLEIGSYLAHLGSKVTVVEATDQLLGGVADPDAVQVVARKLKKTGVDVLMKTKAIQQSEKGKKTIVEVETAGGEKKQLECDHVLVTVGRRPNSDQAGLKRIGVEIDQKGFVVIDRQCRTNFDHIFAIGDLAGQPMLAHKASHEGVLVADVISGMNRAFDAKTVPAVVFTDPEVAAVGMTEAEAKAAGYTDVLVSKFPFGANGRAVSLMQAEGFVKMIADKESHVLLGVHIVGPEASNMISEAALALEMGATLEDLALTIHPHPTLGETMMESAEMALGHAIHVIQKPLRN